ncbi:hypothetical protein CIB48_g6660 [Xylaria polymorpha]|nr:hypothetical protein CIB48_g6660 [Xylaria polymorpha]
MHNPADLSSEPNGDHSTTPGNIKYLVRVSQFGPVRRVKVQCHIPDIVNLPPVPISSRIVRDPKDHKLVRVPSHYESLDYVTSSGRSLSGPTFTDILVMPSFLYPTGASEIHKLSSTHSILALPPTLTSPNQTKQMASYVELESRQKWKVIILWSSSQSCLPMSKRDSQRRYRPPRPITQGDYDIQGSKKTP